MALIPVQINGKTTLCDVNHIDTLYLCDPKLNNACSKENCKINGGECCMTKNPAYAKAINSND